jgi:hypothetical protein
VTSICLTNIILRELFWQGRLIAQIRKPPLIPETYRAEWAPEEPDPQVRGYVGVQFSRLRNVLILGWALWILVSVGSAVWR